MKKIITIFLLILMVFNLAACAKSNTPSENDEIVEENPQDIEDEEDEIVEPTPKTDEVEVILYFANKEYVETGDESLEKLITRKELLNMVIFLWKKESLKIMKDQIR